MEIEILGPLVSMQVHADAGVYSRNKNSSKLTEKKKKKNLSKGDVSVDGCCGGSACTNRSVKLFVCPELSWDKAILF